jgi:D-alanyl-D-alanine carboxypeptidase (penicillin-binding protein 5/6)
VKPGRRAGIRLIRTLGLAFGLVASSLAGEIASGVTPGALNLAAKSAILIDERSGVVLFEKDADAIRYPASTTKVLTSLLLLELVPLDSAVSAPESCVQVEGSSLHLKPFEQVKAKDLLFGILLRSANDACHALAVHVSGSDEEFAKLMNQRASEIGCRRTHFVRPHGLHDDTHYTTARDLMLIAREAMKNDVFRQVGNCFVGSAMRNGYRFISVILNSPDWKADQKALMNWGFRSYQRSVVIKRGDEAMTVPVPGGMPTELPVRLNEDVHYAHSIETPPVLTRTFTPRFDFKLPVEIGAEVGTITLADGRGWTKELPAFALAPATARPMVAGATNWWSTPIAVGLIGLTLLVRNRTKRIVTNYSQSPKCPNR